jgi:hypothetical protein
MTAAQVKYPPVTENKPCSKASPFQFSLKHSSILIIFICCSVAVPASTATCKPKNATTLDEQARHLLLASSTHPSL